MIDGTSRFGFLEVRTERSDDEHVIALAGELDLDGAERVTQELERAEATDARRIVLDLSSLEFIDSNGIRLVLAADARSRMDGHRLALVRAPQTVHRVFELTGVAERLPFVDCACLRSDSLEGQPMAKIRKSSKRSVVVQSGRSAKGRSVTAKGEPGEDATTSGPAGGAGSAKGGAGGSASAEGSSATSASVKIQTTGP